MDNQTGKIKYLDYGNTTTVHVIVNGYAVPFVSFLAMVTNILLCLILLRTQQKTATNLLLVGIAVADTLSGLFPVPFYIYLYSMGNYKDYVPSEWCSQSLSIIMSTMFHTISVWLTVTIAIHRHMRIHNPICVAKLFTTMKTIMIITVIFLLGILTHAVRLAEYKYTPEIVVSKLMPDKKIVGCSYSQYKWRTPTYSTMFFIMRILFIQIIPCTCLVVTNALLIHAINKTKKLRRTPSSRYNQRKYHYSHQDRRSTQMTMLLTVIIGTTLLVEVTPTIMMSLKVIQDLLNVRIIPIITTNTISTISNFSIILSYPTNFIAYCAMSQSFREGFRSLFLPFTCPRVEKT